MADTAAKLFALLFLGFFLGLRHPTDADHIVASATIVSRQRTMHSSMQIGRQSEWATTPIGRAVQLRATWLILDLPSHEPGAAFYGVTVWAKWIIDRAKT